MSSSGKEAFKGTVLFSPTPLEVDPQTTVFGLGLADGTLVEVFLPTIIAEKYAESFRRGVSVSFVGEVTQRSMTVTADKLEQPAQTG